MLDAYVVGGADRELVYRQHARFVDNYQFWGHWAHKRRDAQSRIHNFGLYVDWALSGQSVEVLIYDDAVRIEQAEHLLVLYSCIDDT